MVGGEAVLQHFWILTGEQTAVREQNQKSWTELTTKSDDKIFLWALTHKQVGKTQQLHTLHGIRVSVQEEGSNRMTSDRSENRRPQNSQQAFSGKHNGPTGGSSESGKVFYSPMLSGCMGWGKKAWGAGTSSTQELSKLTHQDPQIRATQWGKALGGKSKWAASRMGRTGMRKREGVEQSREEG